MDYDLLVIGSGIAGMEAALKLGDMGYRVLLAEKEPSVGGKMILLSKVFPTLDCASCISTPKMAAAAHHPNVEAMVYTEVQQVNKTGRGTFQVKIRKKPTFVNPALCTGCRQCETACSVAVPDQFNFDLVARRAAYIAFPQAVPKKAVIERQGTSPCSFACPAGIKAHGYVALTRRGKYAEAFELILETTPLVGSLGRACYAPCEGECTRGRLEGPVSIRKIKRFLADRYYREHPEAVVKPSAGTSAGPAAEPPAEPAGPAAELSAGPPPKKVAVVGAGPAGLTCAFHLAKRGYQVKIFEKEPLPGGMLRTAIPAYRLPKDVLDRDIQNVTALGVKIETGAAVEDPAALLGQGFAAVFVAAGTGGTRRMGIEGENLEGVTGALDFLRAANRGEKIPLEGKTVIVAGGGNVAVDAARVARRLGAARVIVQYRRSREEMPAHDWEIAAAEEEGVQFQYLRAPQRFLGENGKLTHVESMKMKLGAPDAGGRRKPEPVPGTAHRIPAGLAILAVGLVPQTASFSPQLALKKDGTIAADPGTLQTSVPGIFAGGDVVTGPATIVSAVAQGRRAAFFIDRYLKGEELQPADFDYRLPAVDREKVLGRQQSYRKLPPAPARELSPAERTAGFAEVELPLTEEEARSGAGRCLDCGVCAECRQCVAACPAGAVDLAMKEAEEEVEVGAVILATGYRLFPAERKTLYGYGKFKNVITGMQMDRLLAPTRPFNTILRPSDGKIPDNIAYVLCTGSRDCTVNNPLCSRVCCMYSIKQIQLIMGALPLADVTAYYMDIRAFGKGYEEFYAQAGEMGANFVRGRVAEITETENGNLVLAYEDIEQGRTVRAEHDLVVLSVGLLANGAPAGLFTGEGPALDEFRWVKEAAEDLHPGKTSVEGVFVAGTASGAKDIPDTILHAGAAAAQAAAYVERIGRGT